jgi:hypothetical protein
MLRHVEVVSDLADRAKRFWGLVENGLISFERGRLSSPSPDDGGPFVCAAPAEPVHAKSRQIGNS